MTVREISVQALPQTAVLGGMKHVIAQGLMGAADLPEHAAITWQANFEHAAQTLRAREIGELAPLADLAYRAVSVAGNRREVLIGALLQVWEMARADLKAAYEADRKAERDALRERASRAAAEAVAKVLA